MQQEFRSILGYRNRGSVLAMTTLGDRVRARREELGLSQVALAERVGMSQQGIVSIEKGESGRPRRLLELGRALGVTPMWLLTGDDGAQPDEPKRVPVGQEFEPDPGDGVPASDGVSSLEPYKGKLPGAIPDIDVSAGAGPGGLALPTAIDHHGVIYSADAIRGEIVFPPEVLTQYTRAGAGRVHSIAVRGDSMMPTLAHGDRVFVDTTDTAIGQGGLFVLRDPYGEVLVKRLARLSHEEIAVISDNPKQPDQRFPADEIAIIGRVVARLSRPE